MIPETAPAPLQWPRPAAVADAEDDADESWWGDEDLKKKQIKIINILFLFALSFKFYKFWFSFFLIYCLFEDGL